MSSTTRSVDDAADEAMADGFVAVRADDLRLVLSWLAEGDTVYTPCEPDDLATLDRIGAALAGKATR